MTEKTYRFARIISEKTTVSKEMVEQSTSGSYLEMVQEGLFAELNDHIGTQLEEDLMAVLKTPARIDKYGWLYIREEYPIEFQQSVGDTFSDTFEVRLTQRYVLRRRTSEEIDNYIRELTK